MPRTNTGVPTRHPDSIAVPNDPILASKYNTTLDDIVSMLADATTKDGKIGFTSPVSGVPATAASHLTPLSQVQSEAASAAAAAVAAGAPIIKPRVAAIFNAGTTTTTACTYSITANVITVTLANHGQLVDHRVVINSTSGGIFPGQYTLRVTSVPNPNTFTASLTAANTSGAAQVLKCAITSSINVHSVTTLGAPDYILYMNYTTVAPDANQYIFGMTTDSVPSSNVAVMSLNTVPLVSSCAVLFSTNASGSYAPGYAQVVASW